MKTKVLTVVLFSFLAAGVACILAGCNERPVPVEEQVGFGEGIPDAIEAQQYCPVTGLEGVDPDIHTVYQGQRVYFCSHACVETFLTDPDRYMRELYELHEEVP